MLLTSSTPQQEYYELFWEFHRLQTN